MKNRACIYARYSTDQQRDTSLEDQIRRCREVAIRHGLVVDETLVFSDAALSGTAKHRDRRVGYNKMLAAWDAGQFDVLIADDLSRLTRDGVEQALLIRKLEDNQRVRLLTSNGIDTLVPNWQLQVGVMGAVGQQAIRDNKHLVVRGMIGQLERGFMVATPPLGFALDRDIDSQGFCRGTHWKFDEAAVEIITKIFTMRSEGKSMHQIAKYLNDQGVPLTRAARTINGGFWRPSRVKGILMNPIYRGEFLWNNSTTVRNKAKKSGCEVIVQSFLRPKLRIVSDEMWFRCNDGIISRSGYGGGKHALAGLLTCGQCGSVLVVTSKSRCRSLYCAHCTSASAMTSQTDCQTSTIAVAGVETLLTIALREFLTSGFIQLFRDKLRAELTSDCRRDLENLREELARQTRIQDRMSRLLRDAADDDPMLTQHYFEARDNAQATSRRIASMEASMTPIDQAALDAQMSIDPMNLIERVFNSDIPPERMRTMLARLFPKITFDGKPNGRYTSHFTIGFCMGSALSIASDTGSLLKDVTTRRYALSYIPGHTGKIKSTWIVKAIPEEPDST